MEEDAKMKDKICRIEDTKMKERYGKEPEYKKGNDKYNFLFTISSRVDLKLHINVM